MRLIACLAALSGCQLAVPIAGITARATLDCVAGASRAEAAAAEHERAEAEAHHLDGLVARSRFKLDAPCAVQTQRTSARAWRFTSCLGAVKCWATTEFEYRCDDAIVATPQL